MRGSQCHVSPWGGRYHLLRRARTPRRSQAPLDVSSEDNENKVLITIVSTTRATITQGLPRRKNISNIRLFGKESGFENLHKKHHTRFIPYLQTMYKILLKCTFTCLLPLLLLQLLLLLLLTSSLPLLTYFPYFRKNKSSFMRSPRCL